FAVIVCAFAESAVSFAIASDCFISPAWRSDESLPSRASLYVSRHSKVVKIANNQVGNISHQSGELAFGSGESCGAAAGISRPELVLPSFAALAATLERS